MSYNCDSIDIVAGSLSISRGKLAALAIEADDRPEDCILEECEGPAEEILEPKVISWCGEGSGFTWKTFLTVIAAFSGSADLVCCFEGGDSYEGLRVRDGKVTRHKVVMALGEPERPE